MTTKLEALLAEVARLDAAATPGEWRFVTLPWYAGDEHPARCIMPPDRTEQDDAILCDRTYYPWCPDEDADWQYIARARTLLPDLARIVALQRRALEAVPLAHTAGCRAAIRNVAQDASPAARAGDCTCHVALVRAALAGEEETR